MAACIFLYALGDHLDGMQAKRSKTSSPLGELCDHGLDIINNGILQFILLSVYQVDNVWVWVFMLCTAYLPHAGVIYEENKTKWLVFEKIGSLEAVFLSCILILLAAVPQVFSFLSMQVGPLKLLEWVLLGTIFGTTSTLMNIYLRAKGFDWRFYLFAVGLFLLSVTSGLLLIAHPELNGAGIVCLLITLYSTYYIVRVMSAHLADKIERSPDLLAPLVLLVAVFLPAWQMQLLLAVLFYLLLQVLVRATVAIWKLKGFWLWWNPAER